jgi:hypothetical protein
MGITPRWLFVTWLNAFTFSMLFGLAINFSIVQWKLDPLYVLFFMRSVGPVFYLNHYSSTIAITVTMLVFALKNPSNAFRIAIPILATVGIHEIILASVMFSLSLEYLISPAYIIEWLAWISFGVYLANRELRKTLLNVTTVIIIITVVWALIIGTTHHSMLTIIPQGNTFVPGPMYLDPLDNALEVFSWLIPLSVWYWPKKAIWVKEFERHE